MATINFVLQGKGGVGKSLIASLLTQHYQSRGIETLCFDTDPVNATFAAYEVFKVTKVDVLENGYINPRVFDSMIEAIDSAPEDSAIIIDNGASTFIPLCSYLLENGIIRFLIEKGHKVFFHSVITGGQALPDTMNGLNALFENFPGTPVVVWLNEYFGKPQFNGISFEETKLFIKNKNNIHALITIHEVNRETFGYDIQTMLKQRLTFKEANKTPSITIMARQRLVMTWRKLNEQMNGANL